MAGRVEMVSARTCMEVEVACGMRGGGAGAQVGNSAYLVENPIKWQKTAFLGRNSPFLVEILLIRYSSAYLQKNLSFQIFFYVHQVQIFVFQTKIHPICQKNLRFDRALMTANFGRKNRAIKQKINQICQKFIRIETKFYYFDTPLIQSASQLASQLVKCSKIRIKE